MIWSDKEQNQLEMKLEPIVANSGKRPIVVAGPCSAETEEQVLAVAEGLKPLGIDFFRAGVWKPRTRPGNFEGSGEKALPWLRKVKERYGLKVITEVANREHLFAALKSGIDAVWIGARTTVNPFSVQEIADALRGLDIPVFIKNPVNPDLHLWIGAIERIYEAGIRRLAVIHRGYSAYGSSKYRNNPLWQIPIELKRRFPALPVLIDSSHICGERSGLLAVAQKAMDLNYAGLMMEVHPNPDEAWSDKAQQVTPGRFAEILDALVLRDAATDDEEFQNQLEQLREEIDEIDEQLLKILGRRMKVVERIGLYKKRNNIAIFQANRWGEILGRAQAYGRLQGLSPDFVEAYLRAIHEESINHQMKVMNDGS